MLAISAAFLSLCSAPGSAVIARRSASANIGDMKFPITYEVIEYRINRNNKKKIKKKR